MTGSPIDGLSGKDKLSLLAILVTAPVWIPIGFIIGGVKKIFKKKK